MKLSFNNYVRFDLIEDGKVKHYFRVVFKDNLRALVDNKFNTIKIYNYNNNGVRSCQTSTKNI